MKSHFKFFYLIILISFIASGCSFLPGKNSKQPETSSEVEPIVQANIEAVLSGENQIAYIDNGVVKLVDIKNTYSVPVHQLEPNQYPALNTFDTVKLSPSKEYLVWYAPQAGYIKLNLSNNQLTVFQIANQWLNNNPFFGFSDTGDTVYYVNDQGERFYAHNLKTNQTTSVSIPFPFGNTFNISPDESVVIFISAFGQNDQNPEYLITDMQGGNPVRFSTATVLSKRSYVAWMPDSSGVILIGEGNKLVFVDKLTGEISPWYSHTSEATIVSLYQQEGLFYFHTEDNWWFVLDPQTQKIVGRVPTEIASDLHRPVFIPWKNKTFLIEERIRQESQTFNRLWQTNFIGVKTLILSEYNRLEVIDDTPSI